MKNRALCLFLCLCLCLGLLPASALAAGTQTVKVVLTVDYAAAFEELDQLNELRRKNGCSELVMDANMMDMAIRRAAECAVYYSHTRPDGQKFDTAYSSSLKGTRAENILYGRSQSVSASRATDSWYDSSGHRENMLNSIYNCAGIACLRDLAGNTYWVQEFSTSSAKAAAPRSSGQEQFRFSVDTDPQYLTVRLSQSSLRLDPGEEETVYIFNDRGTPLEPGSMRSDNESVASLSQDGSGVRVTAVGGGSATVTLSVGGKTLSLPVTVNQPVQTVELERLKLDGIYASKAYLHVGESLTTQVLFLPEGAPSYEVVWDLYDYETASISVDGPRCTITALKPGTNELYVQTADAIDGCYYATYSEIIILGGSPSEPQEPAEPEEPETPAEPEEPETPVEPEEPETPAEPQEPEVPAQADDIDLSASYAELIPGEQLKLMAYVRPNGAEQGVTWSSRDTSVAIVDQNGRVTGVQKGVAEIVASTPDGEIAASCRVRVDGGFGGKPIYFTDVNENAYFYDAVAWATAQNLQPAIEGEEFGVERGCSRLDIVRYLWKLMGSPQPENTGSTRFTDISDSVGDRDDRWAVQWAVEAGVTTGTGDYTFSPDVRVTRAEAMTFIHRALGTPGASGGTSFSDVPADSWFTEAAVWAVQNGVTTGTSATTFTPHQVCSRGEIITFLYRTFN